MLTKKEVEDLYNAFHEEMPVFIAFSDDERLKLFLRILQAGPQGIHVNDLTSFSRLSRPAVSHHLKILKNSGLISFHKEGTKIYYFIASDEKFNELKKNLSVLGEGFAKINLEEIQENSGQLVDMLQSVEK